MCQDLKSNSSVKPILNTHSAEMVTTPITITNIASIWPKCNGTSFHMYVYFASQRSEQPKNGQLEPITKRLYKDIFLLRPSATYAKYAEYAFVEYAENAEYAKYAN